MSFNLTSPFIADLQKLLLPRVRSLRAIGFIRLTHRTRQTSLSCPMSLWGVRRANATLLHCLRHCCPHTFHEGQPITEVPLKQKGPFLW